MTRDWLRTAKNLSPPEEANAFQLDAIEEEISLLEKKLSGNHQLIGFCHNDLQYGNIMIDEETSSITLIVSFSYYPGYLVYNFPRQICKATTVGCWFSQKPVTKFYMRQSSHYEAGNKCNLIVNVLINIQ